MEASDSRRPHPARRQYLINRRYQGRFMAAFFGLAALVAVGAAWVVYRTTEGVLSEAMYRSHMPTGQPWQLIWPALVRTNLLLAGSSFLLAVLAVFLIARRSTRALRGIEAEVRAIDSPNKVHPGGTESSLSLDVYGLALDGLREQFRPFIEAADRLDDAAMQGEQTLAKGGPVDTSRLTSEVECAMKTIEENCRRFQ